MVARKEIRVFKRFASCNSVFLKGVFDGGEEHSFINGLGEKLHRTIFHRPHSGGNVTPSGNEDNWN